MVEKQRFLRELPGWVLRGGVCALPSAWFALCVIPPSFAMLAGILTGFALVVAAFAAVCSNLDHDGPPWGRALRIAAWIRAGLSIGPGLYLDVILPSETHNDNSFAQDAQQHNYPRLLAAGIEIYEYLNHFNHLKLAVFDERYSIHGSTNLNYRSLEDDKDFELVVCIDDREFAAQNLREVRDEDVRHARHFTHRQISGLSPAALRVRIRHPWTQLMLWRRVL